MAQAQQRNQEATIYIGNLAEECDDEILWEIFVQCGPVANVSVPRDRVTRRHNGYGFVEYRLARDAEYAMRVLNLCPIFGKPIKINKSSLSTSTDVANGGFTLGTFVDQRTEDVGAHLFIGNLHSSVDSKILYDAFSRFGHIISEPSIVLNENNQGLAHGFLSYDNFESADKAIECMNGEMFMNNPISVEYKLRKDGNGRHGSDAERLLAREKGHLAGSVAPKLNTMFYEEEEEEVKPTLTTGRTEIKAPLPPPSKPLPPPPVDQIPNPPNVPPPPPKEN
eukprot:maker-scaffold_44-snap-gene-1.96-mRNA-1 protein AED:0.01 eAED:0.01 QI:82/1/1/1/0/0.5/2/63/279